MIIEIIMAAMGIYVLVSGIRGHGRLYTTQHIKEGCEEKSMKGQKIIYLVLGTSMLTNALASILQMLLYTAETADGTVTYVPTGRMTESLAWLKAEMLNAVAFTFMAISILTIIALFIFLRKVMDKPEKKKQARETPKAAPGTVLPSSAFEFEDAIEGDHWVNPARLAKEKRQAKAAAAAADAEARETEARGGDAAGEE